MAYEWSPPPVKSHFKPYSIAKITLYLAEVKKTNI